MPSVLAKWKVNLAPRPSRRLVSQPPGWHGVRGHPHPGSRLPACLLQQYRASPRLRPAPSLTPARPPSPRRHRDSRMQFDLVHEARAVIPNTMHGRRVPGLPRHRVIMEYDERVPPASPSDPADAEVKIHASQRDGITGSSASINTSLNGSHTQRCHYANTTQKESKDAGTDITDSVT